MMKPTLTLIEGKEEDTITDLTGSELPVADLDCQMKICCRPLLTHHFPSPNHGSVNQRSVEGVLIEQPGGGCQIFISVKMKMLELHHCLDDVDDGRR
ncbi:hypothetical protein ACLOJK_034764 [Asimina triloba]